MLNPARERAPSPWARLTSEGAADLAGRLGAELETVFVEDLALLQWTELPFIRQVGLHGLAGMPVSPRDLELQFRALAAEAQRKLAAIAALQQLRWSFRVRAAKFQMR